MRYTVFLFTMLVFLSSYLFSLSSTTITSDIQFSYFDRINVSIKGSKENAVLLLNNYFEKLQLANFPPKRHSYAADFSTTTQKIFLFSGIDDESYPLKLYNDCWVFDILSSSWTKVFVSTSVLPPARYGSCMVNIGGDRFLLFGGLGEQGYLNDTYIFYLSSLTFQNIQTSTIPPARYYHSMCYDTYQNKVYLFGGVYQGIPYNDLWEFDINSLTWKKITPVNTPPPARWGHKMVYVETNKKIYIFGGQRGYADTDLFNDLWFYDTQTNSFLQIQTVAPFVTQFGMCVYPEINCILIFGGYSGSQNFSSDLWFYNYVSTSFIKSDSLYLSPPQGREKFWFIKTLDRFFLFGGTNGITPLYDNYFYYYSTYGVVTSDIIFVYNPTQVYYKQLLLTPVNLPDGADVKFQVSYSTDGKTFFSYLGPDGTQNTYFTVYQQNFSTNVFNNKQFLKLKGYFSTSKPPNNPYVDEIVIKYNLAPYPPELVEPKNYTSTNTVTPIFKWTPPQDPNNDTVFSYHIQVAKTTDFYQLIVDQESIPQNYYQASLQTGVYYWHVRAKDTDYGLFSNYYRLEVDTTPPSPVNYINAYTGYFNNQITVETIITGDDINAGFLRGTIIIACSSTTKILTEEDFMSAQKFKYDLLYPQRPDSKITFTLNGLQNNTTYYINLKLADEAYNLSQISTICVTAITNFNPEVKILKPTSNSVLSGDKIEFSWTYYDNNPEDRHTFQIYISTDSINFIPISEVLPDKTTFYVWNSLSVHNNLYFIKVTAKDQRSAEGYDIIENIKVSNSNFPPKILSFVHPKENDILFGTTKISWSIYDPNLADTHTYIIYITTDEQHFILVDTINYDTTYYFFDTTKFYNGKNYKLKLLVSDGEYTDILLSDRFSIKNNNLPPEKPQIVSPKNFSFTSPYKVKLQWQKSSDPNINDFVVYDIFLSTDKNFNSLTFSTTNLNQTYYEVFSPVIQEEKSYFWYVKAKDIFEEFTNSEVFMFTTYPRYKSVSEDYRIYVELLDLPQEKIFIFVSKLCDYEQRKNFQSIFSADIKDKTNRFIKIVPYDVYEIRLYNENFIPTDVKLRYKIVAANTVKNHFPKENIKIVYLDEQNNEWKFTRDKQNYVSAKKYGLDSDEGIETTSSIYGYYTLLAKDTSYEPVSHVTIYPNPFDPAKEKLTVEYYLSEDVDIEVYILTKSGGLVKKFVFDKGVQGVSKSTPEGEKNSFQWDGKNEEGKIVSSGMYVCKLVFGRKIEYKYIGVVRK